MVVTARNIIKLYKFPLGRCVFALRNAADRAAGAGMLDVEQLARKSAGEVQQFLSTFLRYQAIPDNQYPPEATSVDNLVDRGIGGLAAYLDVQMRVYPGEPRALAAERVAQALLPSGVAAITQLPFTEQHEHVNHLLDRAADPELAADLLLLSELPELLDRLRERNREFGAILGRSQTPPTRLEIQVLHEQAQERLAEVVALVFGRHAASRPATGPEDTSVRDHVLEPVMQQNEALRQLHRRRRAPADVDPQTGQELPDTQPAQPGTGETLSFLNA